jgi:beta-aspartyl-peptidase (threonine type)
MLSKPPFTHPELTQSRRGISATLLTRIRNPSQLVRALYLSPEVAPHPFLSGSEVERIASENLGQSLVDPSYFFTEKRWREHRRGLGLPEEPLPDEEAIEEPPNDFDTDALPKGTVGAVALDANGCIAVLTSTGGKTNKLVGRIGDTPHMGAGFWAGEWIAKRRWLHFWKPKQRRAVGISGTGDGDVSGYPV